MDVRAKPVPPAWGIEIDSWAAHLKVGGRSVETVRTRTDHMRRAARALGGTPWATTDAAVLDCVAGPDWSRETRRSVYASLRGFWRWGMQAGRCSTSPVADLPSIAPSPPCPKPTPEGDYNRAVAVADGRTRLILLLAAQAGLRRAEIAQIHRSDLLEDLTGQSLIVHGKGGKTRIVPLPDPLALTLRQAIMAGGGYAFPGDDDGHLSPRYVGTLASRVLPQGWALHSLRHRFATVAYGETPDLLILQLLLGHASPATTQRYIAPDMTRLRAVARAAA